MDETKLTPESIVAEAVLLLQEDGLEGVSLRKLAARLGVKAPSLYWHFPDKSALLAAVMEKIFDECVDSVPESAHWQTWMRSFGQALWRTQNAVRDAGRLITTTDVGSAQLARSDERIRGKVRGLDLPEAQAMRLQATIQALITGWSAFANAPYAKSLAATPSLQEMAMQDLDAIINGQAHIWKTQARVKSPA